MGAVPLSLGTLAGVRDLASMRRDELVALGEETRDLSKVVELGIPCGAIWLIGLSDDAEGKTLAAVTAALALDLQRPVVELGGFFASRSIRQRSARLWPQTFALRRGDDVRARVRELFRVLGSEEMIAALGGIRTGVGVRVTVRDDEPLGRAYSVDPETGDPEVIAVISGTHPAVQVDRKTMRAVPSTKTALGPAAIERAADLADRAQLALGRPVEVAFGHLRGRQVLLGVQPIELHPAFTDTTYQRVALLSSDEGPIAPLAVDVLDRALSSSVLSGSSDAPVAVRFYARAYRRSTGILAVEPRADGMRNFLARWAQKAAVRARDLARPMLSVGGLEQLVSEQIALFDREPLGSLDIPGLLTSLRERHALVVDAFSHLESARIATSSMITTLEATTGALPREAIDALSSIRRTKVRRRNEERLARFAQRLIEDLGHIPEAHRVPNSVRATWDAAKLELGGIRPLSVDVRPLPIGTDDRTFRAALLDMTTRDLDAAEHARRETLRRLLATTRTRALGRAREPIAFSTAVALGQLAETKGRIAEALAAALLRLRAGACAAGDRLLEMGLLDENEDALYLDLREIEEAMSGEPGAYAARVRLRREADARWRAYDPPWKLGARRGR